MKTQKWVYKVQKIDLIERNWFKGTWGSKEVVTLKNQKKKKISEYITRSCKSMDTFANLYTKRLVNDIANQLATFPSFYKV